MNVKYESPTTNLNTVVVRLLSSNLLQNLDIPLSRFVKYYFL